MNHLLSVPLKADEGWLAAEAESDEKGKWIDGSAGGGRRGHAGAQWAAQPGLDDGGGRNGVRNGRHGQTMRHSPAKRRAEAAAGHARCRCGLPTACAVKNSRCDRHAGHPLTADCANGCSCIRSGLRPA